MSATCVQGRGRRGPCNVLGLNDFWEEKKNTRSWFEGNKATVCQNVDMSLLANSGASRPSHPRVARLVWGWDQEPNGLSSHSLSTQLCICTGTN
jgi:hypothetical protein